MKAISLFSSYGLGDLGLRAAGAEIALMAELLPQRCAYLRRNFPEARVEEGDLSDPARLREVLDAADRLLSGQPPFLLVATPPCQGMSTNGAGKIARAVEAGCREKLDPRNRLVLSALEAVKRLRPAWVVFENVVQMRNTQIEYAGALRRILDIVEGELAPEGYSGGALPVDFRRYGVPQDRNRLITVYGLRASQSVNLIPPPDAETPITLRQAIGRMEPLDAKDKPRGSDPLHRVKMMNDRLYGWVAACTKEGATAYDNQCGCGCRDNPTTPGMQGAGCPTHCKACGALLPRPMVSKPGSPPRIVSGFRTAYKRMSWDSPAPTVTMNLMTPSSDNKLHPQQNRTLSPAEAAVLQTVDRYKYDWGESPTDRELCDALGEAVPPLFFEKLLRHIASL